MKSYIIDIEGDGLDATKIYCLSFIEADPNKKDPKSIVDYSEMIKVLSEADEIIGHYFMLWDADTLERILKIKINARIIDTIALSWYLYPELLKHGLEDWGEYFGIPKPEINDWFNLPLQDYIYRCEEDVKINHRLWFKIQGYLKILYPNPDDRDKLINYLMFKMKCVRQQSFEGWKLDVDKTKENIAILTKERDTRFTELKNAMPKVPIFSKKKRPSKYHKKDNSITAIGMRWEQLCKENNVHPFEVDELDVIIDYKEPNPNSHPQLKEWLFSLGWEPCTFKYDKKDGVERAIPQISSLEDKSELAPSVKLLVEKEPALGSLEGLFLLNHRISILENFLKDQKDGYIKAEISGFTNTLRLKHKTIVNLPGVDKPYGEFIRGVLIAPDGWELCGSDMASLEDRTKQHYIFDYDPDYVNEMNVPGFDPHLDIAVLSSMMTQEDADNYKKGDHSKKSIRHKAKTTNYSCTYGAFPPKIARTANMLLEEAKQLWTTYWERNWAVKKVAENCRVIEVEGQKWLFNPVSRFFYSLRHEKDRFSTLNQGTGSYCFDVYLGFVLSKRPQVTAQFHDEFILTVKKGYREEIKTILREAIDETNDLLKLNRELDIGIEFGDNYAQIH